VTHRRYCLPARTVCRVVRRVNPAGQKSRVRTAEIFLRGMCFFMNIDDALDSLAFSKESMFVDRINNAYALTALRFRGEGRRSSVSPGAGVPAPRRLKYRCGLVFSPSRAHSP